MLLQDGLTSQVVGQSAVGSPDCEFPVDAHLDHLLLPGDGDVPRGKLIKKLPVIVFQLHAFDRGEGPDVVDVLGINCLGVWHKRGRKDPCGETTQEEADEANFILVIERLPFKLCLNTLIDSVTTSQLDVAKS